jgi:hydrogenase maturation protease
MNELEWQLLEDKKSVDHILVGEVEVRIGDRVRLLPRKGGDILDIALQGQAATVESIEEDYEGNAHLGVVLDDDPGRDLGLLRQPGHRFFFSPSEVEPLDGETHCQMGTNEKPRILVAGIGNIFLGDDGFGVEVAQQLAAIPLPATVRVADFGIRGLDLAYALQDGYEMAILIDVYPRGQSPGTISVVELDLDDPAAALGHDSFVVPHAMDPVSVLRMAAANRGNLKRALLIGCEPATLGGEEGKMGLSIPVGAAVYDAVKVIGNLIDGILKADQADEKN